MPNNEFEGYLKQVMDEMPDWNSSEKSLELRYHPLCPEKAEPKPITLSVTKSM